MADKSRYFAFVVYPENRYLWDIPWSSPDTDDYDELREQLAKILGDTFGQFAISPLHSPDEKDAKPHWHVIYKHPNTCSLKAAQKVIPTGLAANDFLLILHHPKVYQRYLIHLDDPDKEQFQDGAGSILLVNRFPLELTRDFSQSEQNQMRDDIFEWIRNHEIFEYCDLIDSLTYSGEIDLLDYASKKTILFNSYLSSKRGKKKEE